MAALATASELFDPCSAALDGTGNLVIADSSNCRVRVVAASTGTFYGVAMTAADIYTVAGTGSPDFYGDGGPATKAGLDASGVAIAPGGGILIADYSDHWVRLVLG